MDIADLRARLSIDLGDAVVKLNAAKASLEAVEAAAKKAGGQTGGELPKANEAAAKSAASLASGSDKASAALDGMATIAGRAGGAGSALSTVLTALTSPLALVAEGVGALALTFYKSISAITDQVAATKQMIAVSGLGAEAADDLMNTMQLLGLSNDTVTNAMFKMAQEIETGGEGLGRLGVRIRDTSGHLKIEGELFEEVRSRISQLGSAQERAAAAQDVFGRGARELLPVLSLTDEQYRALQERVKGYSDWNEESQKTGNALALSQKELGLATDGLFQKIGLMLAPSVTNANLAMAQMVKTVKDGVVPLFTLLQPTIDNIKTSFSGLGTTLVNLGPIATAAFVVIVEAINTAVVAANMLLVPIAGLTAALGEIFSGNVKGAWDAAHAAMLKQIEVTTKSMNAAIDQTKAFMGAGQAQAKAAETGASAAEEGAGRARRATKAEMDASMDATSKALQARLQAIDLESSTRHLAQTESQADREDVLRGDLAAIDAKLAAVRAAEASARGAISATYNMQAASNPAVSKAIADITAKYGEQASTLLKQKQDLMAQLVIEDQKYQAWDAKQTADWLDAQDKAKRTAYTFVRKLTDDTIALQSTEAQAFDAKTKSETNALLEQATDTIKVNRDLSVAIEHIWELDAAKRQQFDQQTQTRILEAAHNTRTEVENIETQGAASLKATYDTQALMIEGYYTDLGQQAGLSAEEVMRIEQRKQEALGNLNQEYFGKLLALREQNIRQQGESSQQEILMAQMVANEEILVAAAAVDARLKGNQTVLSAYQLLANKEQILHVQEMSLWQAKTRAAGDWSGFFIASLTRAAEEGFSFYDNLETVAKSTAQNMRQGFSSLFFDVLTGQFSSLGDAFKSLGASMLHTVTDFVAAEAVKSLVRLFQYLTGSTSSGSILGGILGSLAIGTPDIAQTGLYLLHQGEAVLPAGMLDKIAGLIYGSGATGADVFAGVADIGAAGLNIPFDQIAEAIGRANSAVDVLNATANPGPDLLGAAGSAVTAALSLFGLISSAQSGNIGGALLSGASFGFSAYSLLASILPSTFPPVSSLLASAFVAIAPDLALTVGTAISSFAPALATALGAGEAVAAAGAAAGGGAAAAGAGFGAIAGGGAVALPALAIIIGQMINDATKANTRRETEAQTYRTSVKDVATAFGQLKAGGLALADLSRPSGLTDPQLMALSLAAETGVQAIGPMSFALGYLTHPDSFNQNLRPQDERENIAFLNAMAPESMLGVLFGLDEITRRRLPIPLFGGAPGLYMPPEADILKILGPAFGVKGSRINAILDAARHPTAEGFVEDVTIPGYGPGTLVPSVRKFLASIGGVPTFEAGTDYVPRTGLALVHEGERITPKGGNAGASFGDVNVTVQGGGDPERIGRAIARQIEESVRAGRIGRQVTIRLA